MQETFSDPADLTDRLRDLIGTEGVVVSVDGIDGSGKSNLGRILARRLDAVHIEIDDFLDRKKGGFIDHIRYSELEEAIQSILSENICIVEGCCALEVLQRLNIIPTVTVYVKRIVAGFLWHDGRFLDKYESSEAAIAGKIEDLEKFQSLIPDLENADVENDNGKTDLTGLRKELIRYHYDYLPHKKAQFIFERRDPNPTE